jgi:uncharacterized membrane protein YphA (DoxX/SURF4 family)
MTTAQTARASTIERRTTTRATSRARYLPLIARVLMGVIFVVMGLNGFLNFIPQPSTPVPAKALAFLGALYSTGYMVPVSSGTQVLVGLLLLGNRWVPLALALIAPIIVNIMLVHLFLAPELIAPAIVVFVLEIYLAWAYRGAFRPMLAARVAPGA